MIIYLINDIYIWYGKCKNDTEVGTLVLSIAEAYSVSDTARLCPILQFRYGHK